MAITRARIMKPAVSKPISPAQKLAAAQQPKPSRARISKPVRSGKGGKGGKF